MSQFYVGITAGSLPPTVPTSFVANDGTTSTPAANIENIVGNNTANNGFATWTTASGNTHLVRSYGPYKWIVNPIAGVGTHQTIAAAVAAASAGDSIFITPGTYTENIVATQSINLIGPDVCEFDQGINNVTIIGKISNSVNGAQVSIVNIRLQTNGDYVLQLTGVNASEIYARNCYLSGTNFSLLSSSNTSPSSSLILQNCFGNLLAVGINVFNHSNGCNLQIVDSQFLNGAVSTTPCVSSSTLILDDVSFGSQTLTGIPITISGSTAEITNCFLQASGGPILLTGGTTLVDNSTTGTITVSNAATLTCNSSSTGAMVFSNTSQGTIYNSTIVTTAAASGITANAGTSVILVSSSINSANTNAITGAGSVSFGSIAFGSSSLNNATTQIPLVSSNDSIKVIRPSSYPYTVTAQDALVSVDTSSAANTVNLPASPAQGQKHIVKDRSANASANNITVSGNGHNIVGTTSAASQTISLNGAAVTYVYDTSVWLAI